MKFVVGKGQEKRCPSSLAPPSLVLWWPEGPQAAGFKTNSHICVEALQEPESSLGSLAKYMYSRNGSGLESKSLAWCDCGTREWDA